MMEGGIRVSSIKTGVNSFKEEKTNHRNILPPLPPLSEEDELNLALENAKHEIKQIKDNVLNNLAAGEAIDIEKVRSVFEKAEANIHQKKENVLQRFSAKANTICTSNAISDRNGVRNVNPMLSEVSITDEKPLNFDKVQKAESYESTYTNVGGHIKSVSITSADPHIGNIEKLKSIINPTRKQARTLLNIYYRASGTGGQEPYQTKIAKSSSMKSQTKPITGSAYKMSGQHCRVSPPPSATPTDTRKGILVMIQRKMIPASSSLTMLSSPIKLKKAILHEPPEKNMHKHEAGLNFALVKFDESSPIPKIPPIVPNASAAASFDDDVSRHQLSKGSPSNHCLEYELSALRNIFPISDMTLLNMPYKIIIQDGRVVTSSDEFIRFNRKHLSNWYGVEKLLVHVEKLMKDFSVPLALVDGERLADMSVHFELGPRPTMKDLLMCVINSAEVEKIILIPGRRYLAADGPDMAATYIQKNWRRHYLNSLYENGKRQKTVTGYKAMKWIMNLKFVYIRNHLKLQNREYRKNFQIRMKVFAENWSIIKASPRIIVHIPSLGYSVKNRKKLADISTRQNCQMGRICDILDPDVEVIYISPTYIDKKMEDYYRGLVRTMCSVSGQDYDDASSRLKIFTPECANRFAPHNLCLSSTLKYSDHLIKKVREMTKGREAYIVPGYTHPDDLYVADKLDLPILGCEPRICQMYSLKSGLYRIFELADVDRAPGEYAVRSKQQFYESLAKLVTQNLHITRWLFKADDSFDGRGTAYCDITPYLEFYNAAVKEAKRYDKEWKEKWAYERMYNIIHPQLPAILRQHGSPVDKSLFENWSDFFKAFLEDGGVIEACPPTELVDGLTANVLLEPDGNIQILSIADQIPSASPYKCWGHAFPLTSVNMDVVKERTRSVMEVCVSRHIVGYVSLDFVTFVDPTTQVQVLWAVGLQIGYSNTQALFRLMTFITDAPPDVENNRLEVTTHIKPKKKPVYVPRSRRDDPPLREKSTERQRRVTVVSPNVYHTNLNTIDYNVLFALCQSHGIAYDDKVKIGTSFSLVDRKKRDVVGMMTIGKDLRQAVSMFVRNLKLLNHEISTPNMLGTNNFSDAIARLEFILERIRKTEQERHLIYPTPDARCRRRIKSARRIRRNAIVVERPMSAGNDQENFDSDFLLEDISTEFEIGVKRRSVR